VRRTSGPTIRQIDAHRREETSMAVIKTIDLVGVSTVSWDDAAHQALAEATATLRNIEGFAVVNTSAVVSENAITEYHTHVQIRFRIAR
jgi:flavin-binding protein dodecin